MATILKKALWADEPELARLRLGAMMFGDETDEKEAPRILDAYLPAGGNFIDTADVYAQGESERILGRLLGPPDGTTC